jgi:hypothetical protein
MDILEQIMEYNLTVNGLYGKSYKHNGIINGHRSRMVANDEGRRTTWGSTATSVDCQL